jgi:ADP-ribose pyrophosphatase YjhB (NUDIX family)
MKYDEIVLNVLNGNTTDESTISFLNNNYDIINKDIIGQSDFIPKCKKTVTYIVQTVLINDKRQVCLIQEAKLSCKGKWYLPAGRMEPNETLLDAVKRECQEETGLIAEPLALCCVEIKSIYLWFRFTFLAKCMGSLKTIEQADKESLMAKWIELDQLDDPIFKTNIRASDFIDIVKLANNYYTHLNINSINISIYELKYLKLPFLNEHQHIIFSFVILDNDLKKFILLNDKLLPSVVFIPNFYLSMTNDFVQYSLNSVIFPKCFKNSNTIKISNKKLLDVDHNGKSNNDGVKFLFLISIRTFSGLNSDTHETNDICQWHLMTSNQEILKRFENKLNFMQLVI